MHPVVHGLNTLTDHPLAWTGLGCGRGGAVRNGGYMDQRDCSRAGAELRGHGGCSKGAVREVECDDGLDALSGRR